MKGSVRDEIPTVRNIRSHRSFNGRVSKLAAKSVTHTAAPQFRNVNAAHPTSTALKPASPSFQPFMRRPAIKADSREATAPARTDRRPSPPMLRQAAAIPIKNRTPVVKRFCSITCAMLREAASVIPCMSILINQYNLPAKLPIPIVASKSVGVFSIYGMPYRKKIVFLHS